ncbi:MAG: hypothetical protein WCI94_14425 [Rhodospirillales bacterium]
MDDFPEAEELDRAAAWRLRKADEGDTASAAAAERLLGIAADLRMHGTTDLVAEYRCICNWLAESEGIEDFNEFAHRYRVEIGFEHTPASGEEYIRALIALSKAVFGDP